VFFFSVYFSAAPSADDALGTVTLCSYSVFIANSPSADDALGRPSMYRVTLCSFSVFIFCPSADDALCVLPDPVAGPSEPRPAAVVPALALGARERDKREHGLLVRRRVRLRTRGRGLGGGKDRPGGAGGAGGAHGRAARSWGERLRVCLGESKAE
jgi:hypothetical protein